jgi:hypothetical protein
MRRSIHAGAVTVAVFSSAGFAAAQNASNRPDLTPTQQQKVSQGLASSLTRPRRPLNPGSETSFPMP